MNLVPWKNKTEKNGGQAGTSITRFREEMDDLFARFFGRGFLDWNLPAGVVGVGPKLDLAETDREVTVTAELPGMDPKDIDIQVTGNGLIIRGEKKHEREEKGRDYHYSERQFGAFHRTVQLPSAVDPDQVQAAYKDGILTITIAKSPEAQPKRIPVKPA